MLLLMIYMQLVVTECQEVLEMVIENVTSHLVVLE